MTHEDSPVSSVSALVQQYLTFRAARERFAKNEDTFKKSLMESLAESGDPDEKGNRFFTLEAPIEGVSGVKRERRVSQVLDEEAAVALVKKYGLEKDCLETIQVLDEDALLAANFAGQIPDDEMQALYSQKESFAFVLVKEK